MFALLLIFFAGYTLAQEYNVPGFPIDESSQKIVFSEVIQTEGDAAQLYSKAINWIEQFYVNPSAVIREKNEQEKKIHIVEPIKLMELPDKDGKEIRSNTRIKYNLYFYFKDGRFKFEITDIHLKAASYQPIEPWLENENQTDRQNYLLIQTYEYLEKLITDMKAFMQSSAGDEADDW